MKFVPRSYQYPAARWLADNPHSGLLADPGSGKTAIVLALLRGLKMMSDGRHRTLVIAPRLIVYDVWPDEIQKWDQFNGLTYSILHGPKKDEAVAEDTDIHLINPEGLKWLATKGYLSRYDALVIDESSKFKNWSAKRFRLLKMYLGKFDRRHILTGTPVPRTLIDFFAQQYILDRGEALGDTITGYQRRYFFDAAPKALNFSIWKPRPGAFDEVVEKVAGISYRLDVHKNLKLPRVHVNDIKCHLPNPKEYKSQIEACESAGEEYTLARRLAGAAKHAPLDNLIDELQGEPLMVFIEFRDEGEAIAARHDAPLIYGGVSGTDTSRYLKQWNARELPVLVMNAAVAGHGLNLQYGGHHLCWFSLPTNQDNYQQAIYRVLRQGQEAPTVFVHRLLASGTIDRKIASMLERKTRDQEAFLAAIERENNANT